MMPSAVSVILGDCLDVLPTLEAASVRCLITDPPYSISRNKVNLDRSHWTSPAARQRILVRDFGPWDQRTPEQHAEWMVAWLTEAYRVMAPGATGYVFCILEDCGRLKTWVETCAFTWVMTVLWVKQNPAPQFVGARQFAYACEAIGMFRKPGKPVTWNGNNTTRNWIATPLCQGAERTAHVCQKPEALFRILVSLSSNKGDLVLDPFVGSGTTCVVCANLNRRCIGIEADKTYVRIADRRVENTIRRLNGEMYLPEPLGPLPLWSNDT